MDKALVTDETRSARVPGTEQAAGGLLPLAIDGHDNPSTTWNVKSGSSKPVFEGER
jgi:hypothetical protein